MRAARPAAFLAFCAAAGLFLWAALSHLPFADWPPLPFDAAQMTTQQIIFAYAILPRGAVAILAGAALGLAGALLQRLLRNPIADPSTLGVSSGAQLAIVAATLFFPEVLDGYRAFVALAGAAAAMALVFLLGWRRAFEPITMAVSGLLVGITCSALSAAMTLSQGEYLMSLVTWNGGSLSQQDWSTTVTLGLELLLGLAVTLLLLRPLTLLGLGDSSARSLGVALAGTRIAVASLAVALSAGVAAAVGLVSFVGLAAPAMVRLLGIRTTRSILLLSPVAGGLLLWLCDGVVQLVASSAGETFPTGSVTALIGGPLLLWLLPQVRAVEPPHPPDSVLVSRAPLSRLVLILCLLPPLAWAALCVARLPDGWTLLSGDLFWELLPARWPRLVASAAAGGLLAMAGAMLQRLTGNPMASPEVLGVSGGAGVGYAVALSVSAGAGAPALFLGAGGGAVFVLIVVALFAARRHLPPERLLLAGISVSAFSSAILSALLAIGDQRAWQILAWLGGSAAAATPGTAAFLAGLTIVILAIGLIFTRWQVILPLGAPTAMALGLPLVGARTMMVLMAGIATAAASLLVGPLSFIGLMAPHIAHRAGFEKPGSRILASAVIGSVLMVIADLGARTATFPYELPLGLFAAFAGAPYLVWMIGRRQ
ncbi:Fe(3+)-hydroxamate ABC transporter permease FhuB [Rhizobium mesosinicum]|uniref:Fe(3+)-hydroxamate ABC transporter permease FhuB n=1 Tax=Rhizobium mesosinicum TaxID=335017 RepID=A0ABS7GNB0_9HYPH|nr:Fe(3+)-hydroxamate ABC transporter permease FhuB [Rhizobium mesosinicum]MBW9051420.1 Fe(3+)-hydroxamate ABC transporter permease FhuB [Rhizobium mesosinicum]